MADVKFDIEVTGVKELRQAADNFQRLGKVSSQLSAQYKPLGAQTVRLVNEQKRLEGVHRSLHKAIQEGTITTKDATRAMQEEIRVSKERILTDKTLIAQAKKKAKAVADLKKENDRLFKLYAPQRAAERQYKEAVKETNRALQLKVINEKEHAESMRRLTFEYNQFTQGLATGGNQFAKFNVESYRANQRMKRFASVGMQQAGYQVGDFIVQIQGGTDVLVALGQQGSQLAGIFGAKGAVVGAVLAGATAIGMIFKQTKEAAEGSAEDIKSAFSTLPDYFDGLGVSIYDSFEGSFDKIEERYGKLIADIAKGELELLKTSAKSVEGPVAQGAAPSFYERLGAALAPGVVGTGTSAAQGQAQANIQAETEELFKSVKPVNDILAAYKEQVDAVQTQAELLSLVKTTYEDIKTVSEDAADAFRQQAKDLGIAGEIAKAEKAAREQEAETLEEREENMLEMIQLFRDFQKRMRDEEEETRREREQNILKLVQVFRESQERIREEERKTRELREDNILDLIQVFRDAQKRMREEEIEETERSLERLFASRTLMYSIRFSGEAGVMSQSLTPSGKMKPKQSYEELIKMGFTPEDLERIGLKPPPKSRSTKTKTPAEQIEEFMVKQEQANKVQRERILLGEDEARVTELINEYKKAGVPLDLERIRTLVEEEQQLQKLESAHASLTDALMSVVDGTQSVGNAFKRLLREMILDIYREKVAKNFASTVIGLFGFGNGGVFSGGSQVKAFANGGVVGGPTYFPMSGGQTGLMGEAGPEAIMPLKRGVDGKLGVQMNGGGEQIVVNQNINISTGVQQTVRNEIQSMMPQIAAQSKSAVLDAKRRGGSYGGKF